MKAYEVDDEGRFSFWRPNTKAYTEDDEASCRPRITVFTETMRSRERDRFSRPVSRQRRTNESTATSSSASSSSTSSVDFELVPIKPSCYTSLGDIKPSPAAHVHSPKAACSAVYSAYQITIRNPLARHAAGAYLQPMSTFPEADETTVLHRL